MTVKESDRVKELESKIKIIEAENELLAEYKEELFLMGQVSEILSTTDSVEEITDALLERTAILKNIPFCAFGEIKDSEIYIGKFYTLFSEEESLEPALFLSENEISELENGVWVCNENSDIKEPRFKSNFSGFQAKGILILPVHVHEIQRSFFLFVDNQRSAEELRLLLPLLHRLCDMSAERMNNIYLLARLKEANENLEKKVDEQTGELRNANIELKKRIAKYQLTRSALQESEKLMRTIAENFPNSFVSIINNDYTVKFSSGQEFKKLGLNPNDYDGLSVDQIFGDKAALVKKHYKKTFEGKEQTFSLFLNNQHQLYKTVPLLNEGIGQIKFWLWLKILLSVKMLNQL